MFNKLEKYQINGNIVGSVSGFQVDNSDPENVVILETANIDGSNTIGGVWWIDRVLSDRFTGEKQVLHAISDDTLEVGNNDLEEVYLLGKSVNSFKVKYGSNIERMWHSGNLVNVSQLDNDVNYTYNDGSNATGDLQETIAWRHVHWNEGILNNITVAFTNALKNAYDAKLDVEDLDGFVYNVTYTSNTHVLTFYRQNQPNIVIDLPIEQLIKGVQLVGDDLVFTFEDGSTVTVPLNTLLVGVVKSVNGLTPNSQGEVVINIADIPGLSTELNKIGALTTLTTTNKNNLVGAINEVNGKTDNIEIGGRNLIPSSEWEIGNIQAGANTSGANFLRTTGYIAVEELSSYTFSVRDITVSSSIVFYNNSNVLLGSVWTTDKSIVTINTPVQTSYIRIAYRPSLGAPNTTIAKSKPQLEKGNKATDWTPAPEDQVSDWSETDSAKYSFIKNKPNTFTPSAHTHPISDVVGLQTDLNQRIVDVEGAYGLGFSQSNIDRPYIQNDLGVNAILATQNWVNQQTGNLPSLNTTNKNNLVAAINEVNSNTDNIEIGGRNLLVLRTVSLGYINHLNGVLVGDSGHRASDFIRVSNFSKVIFSNTEKIAFYYPRIVFYDISKSYISGTVYGPSNFTNNFVLDIPFNAHYLRFSTDVVTNGMPINTIKIEKGTISTDWTPAPEDQISDWNELDSTKFSFIKNKPTLVNNYLDSIITTNGTTAGTVYTFKRVGLSDLSITLTPASASFSGVVTTGTQTFEGVKTFLKSPKVPNAANADDAVNKSQMDSGDANGNTAYSWGDYRNFGLGRYVNAGVGSSPDTLGNNTGFYFTQNAPAEVGGNEAKIINIGNATVSSAVGQIAMGHGYSRMAFRISSATPWVELFHTGIFNPAQYVLQSSLNTQLANYVPINGVTTINNTKTFTSSPIVPTATLDGHAVNLGQLNNSLGNYLPLAGGTMNNGSVINWNSGTSAVIQQGGNNRITISNSNTIISSSVFGTTDGIYLRPRSHTLATGQVKINGNGQITTYSHGNSSQWYEAYQATQNLSTNYVPINGVTTINNTKTFTSSPVVPNATLNSHAVNLGQLNSVLDGNYEQDILFSTDFNTSDVVTLNNPTIFYFTSFVDQLVFQVGDMKRSSELVVHNTSGVDFEFKIPHIKQNGYTGDNVFVLRNNESVSFVLAYISGNPYFAVKHVTDIV